MVNMSFIFLCLATTLIAQETSDHDALLNMREQQKTAYGASYSMLEKQASYVLKKNAATSYRLWWHHAMHRLPRLIFQLLFILSVWLCFYSMLYGSWVFVSSSSGIACIFGLLLFLNYYESNMQWGICKVPEASLHIGPDTRYPNCGTLGYLTEVPFYKKQGDWFFVGGAIRGWVNSQDMGYKE